MNDIVSYLFNTNAIRFCEENKPFWYTSGKIGPYFINMKHYLKKCLKKYINNIKKMKYIKM